MIIVHNRRKVPNHIPWNFSKLVWYKFFKMNKENASILFIQNESNTKIAQGHFHDLKGKQLSPELEHRWPIPFLQKIIFMLTASPSNLIYKMRSGMSFAGLECAFIFPSSINRVLPRLLCRETMISCCLLHKLNSFASFKIIC